MDENRTNVKLTGCSSQESTHAKVITARSQFQHLLQNAIIMTEVGMDMRERCEQGEKYVSYLRSLTLKAGKNLASLNATSKQFLTLAQKLLTSVMTSIDDMPVADHQCFQLKIEYEKLLSVVEKELASDVDDIIEPVAQHSRLSNISEKIKYLETKQKWSDNSFVQPSGSVKSVKSDVDEKYPENWSKDSLIDLNSVINLPPVPEDIFTSFPNKPTKTSSLSSLKSMRRVKLFLQRAANSASDDDDSSEQEDDHKMIIGDTDERPNSSHATKKYLGNIKEETQQD